ncbi:hypothetical protein BJ170DRAFT_719654 [Xylariales sp. AK1849]|nr:hypothetical protein BJ170DRAFT_719654 [Xylariales sp. AK1849]
MRASWNQLFPDQISEDSFQVLAKPLEENRFTLEGHTFKAVDVGHSDTDDTTALWVPALKMAVSGDVSYNDMHMSMVVSTQQSQRDVRIQSPDSTAKYEPAIVVGSHHRLGGVDGAWNIQASREYIRTLIHLQ